MNSIKFLSILLLGFTVASSSVIPTHDDTPDIDAELEAYLQEAKVELYGLFDQMTNMKVMYDDNDDGWKQLEEVILQIHNAYLPIYDKLKSVPLESIKSEALRKAVKIWTEYRVDEFTIRERVVWVKNPLKMIYKGFKNDFCDFNDQSHCNLMYFSDTYKRIAETNDPAELLFHWKQWREHITDNDVDTLMELVEVYQNITKREGKSIPRLWYYYYGHDDFYDQLMQFYGELKPLYKQLHAYVRSKLRQKYGEANVPTRGTIPQHLIDQIFVQSRLMNVAVHYPYPEKMLPDLTEILNEKGFTALQLLEASNDFYNSIGMDDLPSTYMSEKVKPSTNDVCASTKIGKPFSGFEINYCPQVDLMTFLRSYETMADVRYKMKYAHLPFLIDMEACPGFTTALSEPAKLSALTPKYLKQIGLLESDVVDEEFEINRLYHMALYTILPMPMDIVHDKFWIELAQNENPKQISDTLYTSMMAHYAGIRVPRTGEYKSILPYQFLKGLFSWKPNTVNIFSEAMGYEFYESLCAKVGLYRQDDPNSFLKDCNLYGQSSIGSELNTIMSLGVSKSWGEIVEPLTGEKTLSASGILEYFEPLRVWLETENAKNNEPIGW